MYKPMRGRNGQLFYVFDEDAAEELLDFQDTFSDCMDTLIETLENLKDAVLSIDVPNIEPFPEPEMLPEPDPELFRSDDAPGAADDKELICSVTE